MSAPACAPTIDAVAIGASAGGVEALMGILPALPATIGVAILIVVHLQRDRPSLLREIFAAKCRMRVEEALDKSPIEPGCIYFAPPDYHMLVDEGPRIALSIDDQIQFSRPSIDALFESAADFYGNRLLGVLLTGGNEDGAAGLAQIARCDGSTVLQDPAEAVAPVMPQSALKVMTPTHILSLDGIRDLLLTLPAKNIR